MLKRFLIWGNQDISFGDFIGLAFVSCLMRWLKILPLLNLIIVTGLGVTWYWINQVKIIVHV
jgi:hypothetical protein